MAMYRRSSRPLLLVVLCVLTSLTLITVDSRANGGGVVNTFRSGAGDILAPVERVGGTVTHPIGNFVYSAFHQGNLQAENSRLRRENQQLRGQQLQQPDYQNQLRVLEEQLRLDFATDVPTVAAQIIDTSPSNFDATIVVDRGSDNGIAKNMPVVVATGLVGRVESTSSHRAVVRLVTDPSVHVAVTLAQANVNAITAGAGPGNPLNLDMILPGTKPGQDEKVFTSGLQGAAYPKGIPVARVVKANSPSGADFAEVKAQPTADLSHLQYVQILQYLP